MAFQPEAKFTAASNAPTPEDFLNNGLPISEETGKRQILSIVQPSNQEQALEQAVLVIEGEEHVLFLRNAMAIVNPDISRTGVYYVTGDYSGPGSELQLSHTIPELIESAA